MTAQHTPGPWAFAKYSKKRFGLGCAGHGAWMFLQTIYEDADSPELRANARLIAAAPELLDFAKEWLERQGTDENYMVMKARAAIAKATGEKHE